MGRLCHAGHAKAEHRSKWASGRVAQMTLGVGSAPIFGLNEHVRTSDLHYLLINQCDRPVSNLSLPGSCEFAQLSKHANSCRLRVVALNGEQGRKNSVQRSASRLKAEGLELE